MSNRLKGNLAAFIAMLLWSTGFPVVAEILRSWDPLLLAPPRLATSATVLLVLLALTGGLTALRNINWWDITWIGGGILSLSTILLLYGQEITHPVAVAVVISTMPMISATMGLFGGQERISVSLAVGIVLSVSGGIVTSLTPGETGANEGSLYGAALVFIAVTLFVWYTRACNERLSRLPDLAKSGLTLLAAAIIVTDITFAAIGWDLAPLQYDMSWRTLALIGWLGGVAIGIAMALWFTSSRLIGVTLTAMHHNLVPFYVILIAFAAGGSIAKHHLLGACLAVTGALIAQLPALGGTQTRSQTKSRPVVRQSH